MLSTIDLSVRRSAQMGIKMKRSRKLKKIKELEKLERRKMMEELEERSKRKEMEIFRLEDIEFEVNLSIADILKIVDEYGKETGEEYEVEQDRILYDAVSDVTNESVWRVPVIEVRLKEIWKNMDDPFIYFYISDSRKKLAYIANNFDRVFKIL